jgi:hypothetical protein
MVAIRLPSILAFIAIMASVGAAQFCSIDVDGTDYSGVCQDPTQVSCTYSESDPLVCGTEPADVKNTIRNKANIQQVVCCVS